MDYLTTEHRLQAQRLLDDIRGALRVKETQLKESDDEGRILSRCPGRAHWLFHLIRVLPEICLDCLYLGHTVDTENCGEFIEIYKRIRDIVECEHPWYRH